MTVPPKPPAIMPRRTDAGVEAVVSPTGAAGGDVTAVPAFPAHFVTAGGLLHQVDTRAEVLVQGSPGQSFEFLK